MSWSFSALKASETCAFRYQKVDLERKYKDEDRTHLDWGTEVHKAFAQAFLAGVPLPETMTPWQHWVDDFKALPGQILIEKMMGVDRQFNAVPSQAPTVWYKGKGDAIRVDEVVAHIRDWKTGRLPDKDDPTQLALQALLVFAHFPKVLRIRSEFVWLKEDCTTSEMYNRRDVADLWMSIVPRAEYLESMKTTKIFPPKPGRLCKEWCPVKECESHGKSFY
jgi:hypothetical protein